MATSRHNISYISAKQPLKRVLEYLFQYTSGYPSLKYPKIRAPIFYICVYARIINTHSTESYHLR